MRRLQLLALLLFLFPTSAAAEEGTSSYSFFEPTRRMW